MAGTNHQKENLIQRLHALLLGWYERHARDLPWRKTSDPYFIWISEVMLQQTRVDTVIPYYERFIQKFRTVQDLAHADEAQVLKLWEGLGYYRRAKLLHQAAKEVTETYHGQLPQTQEELSNLPGFGPYTSGAVAAIAFGQPSPAIDGNVKRVFSRILATHEPVDPFAAAAANNDDPASWTQAVMELGAMICVAQNPKCLICPVRPVCKAFEKQEVELYPAKSKQKKIRTIYATTWMIQNSKKQLLIRQRSNSGRFAGLWEFPTVETDQPIANTNLLSYSPIQGTFENLQFLGNFTHKLTHRTIVVNVVAVKAKLQLGKQTHEKWADAAQISTYAFSRLQQRALGLFNSK